MPQKPKPRIAVIGAGWAGLSAAAHLVPHAETVLYEAGRTAGGRARSIASGSFSFLDNGQHLLVGAYRSVFALLDKTGTDWRRNFCRLPLQWHLADGASFQAARWLPAPLNLAAAVLGARRATLAEKFSLLRQFARLQAHAKRNPPDQSIASWLDEAHVPQKWREEFWQPMTAGALNTPPETASLNTLCNVLADGVWSSRAASDYLLPRCGLDEAFVRPVLDFILQNGGAWQPETRVGRLECPNGGIRAAGAHFDAAVIAVAPYHLDRLLPEHTGGAARAAAGTLSHHAIATVCLRYAAPPRLPAPMTGFARGTAQWLIDRTRLNGAPEIAAVISLSDTLSGSLKNGGTDALAEAVHADVLRLCPDAGAPIAQQTIVEKRAVAASTVARTLPDTSDLAAAHIHLAGDWLHPRYPATLEAAVQSGQAAATAALAALGIRA